MMGALEGRSALITGGSSGIGLATVERFVQEGAQVGVVDLHPPPGGQADLYIEADVGDPRACRESHKPGAANGASAAHCPDVRTSDATAAIARSPSTSIPASGTVIDATPVGCFVSIGRIASRVSTLDERRRGEHSLSMNHRCQPSPTLRGPRLCQIVRLSANAGGSSFSALPR